MAVGSFNPIVPKGAPVYLRGTRSVAEAATNTSKYGTMVIRDANGRAAEAGAAPATVLGVSAEPRHNDAVASTHELIFWPLTTADEYYITLLEALAQTTIGTDCGLVRDATTGQWYASTADAGAQVQVVDYEKGPGGWAIGDTKATVIVKFHSAKIQGI